MPSFRKGQTIIYPQHGVGTVTGRERVDFLGQPRDVLVIDIPASGLVAKVAVDQVETLGLRPPLPPADLDDLVSTFAAPARSPTHFTRRFKNHQEKIASGGPYELAEVVRNLTSRADTGKLSTAEREQLERSRGLLIAEVAASRGADANTAEATLDEALRVRRSAPAAVAAG